jgi:hypothetical protein
MTTDYRFVVAHWQFLTIRIRQRNLSLWTRDFILGSSSKLTFAGGLVLKGISNTISVYYWSILEWVPDETINKLKSSSMSDIHGAIL